MTDQELRDLIASIAVAQKETDKQIKETAEQLKNTDKQINELGWQLGGLGNKFGSFTEGMAFPAMDKILRQRFNMETVASRVKSTRGGDSLELDVLAYSNDDAVDVPDDLKARVLRAGIYLALIYGETFVLQTPDDLQPRCFTEPMLA